MGLGGCLCGCWHAIIQAPARLRALVVRVGLFVMGFWVMSYFLTLQLPTGSDAWKQMAGEFVEEPSERKPFVAYVVYWLPLLTALLLAALVTPSPRRFLTLAPHSAPTNALLQRVHALFTARNAVLLTHAAFVFLAVVRKAHDEGGDIQGVFYHVGNSLGWLGMLDLGLLTIPTTQKSRFLGPMGLGYEDAVAIHRMLGQWAVSLLAAHGLMHCMCVGHLDLLFPPASCTTGTTVEKRVECGEGPCTCYDYWSNFCGLIALTAISAMAISGLHRFRRKFYRVFYRVHVYAAPVALLFAVMHYEAVFLWVMAGLTFLAATTWPNRLYLKWQPELQVRALTPVPNTRGVVELELERSGRRRKFEAGQWVRLLVPQVSTLIWHPFSVSSAPHDATLRFLIRCNGPWTGQLLKLAEKNAATPLRVRVDAYHGKVDQTALACRAESVVLVAGGVGVTPLLSLYRHLHHLNATNKLPLALKGVHLVWACKEPGLVDRVERELKETTSATNNLTAFTVQVFLTGEGRRNEHAIKMDRNGPPRHGGTGTFAEAGTEAELGVGRTPFDMTRGVRLFASVSCLTVLSVTSIVAWNGHLMYKSLRLETPGQLLFARLLPLVLSLATAGALSALFAFLATKGMGMPKKGPDGRSLEDDDGEEADTELLPMGGGDKAPANDGSQNVNPFFSVPDPNADFNANDAPSAAKGTEEPVGESTYVRTSGSRPDVQALLHRHGRRTTAVFVCGPPALEVAVRDAAHFCHGLHESDQGPSCRFTVHAHTFAL